MERKEDIYECQHCGSQSPLPDSDAESSNTLMELAYKTLSVHDYAGASSFFCQVPKGDPHYNLAAYFESISLLCLRVMADFDADLFTERTQVCVEALLKVASQDYTKIARALGITAGLLLHIALDYLRNAHLTYCESSTLENASEYYCILSKYLQTTHYAVSLLDRAELHSDEHSISFCLLAYPSLIQNTDVYLKGVKYSESTHSARITPDAETTALLIKNKKYYEQRLAEIEQIKARLH